MPAIEALLERQRIWLYTRLAEKEMLIANAPRREMVSGQGFLYLGRSYRLKVVPDGAALGVPLRLFQGYFELRRSAVPRGSEHFMMWYTARAQQVLPERVALYQNRLQVRPAGVRVMNLGHRWGSRSVDGTLNFHWRLILAPLRIVDYVVIHEMLHLHESNHGSDFWRHLSRVMPDHVARQHWLAEHGAELGV